MSVRLSSGEEFELELTFTLKVKLTTYKNSKNFLAIFLLL